MKIIKPFIPYRWNRPKLFFKNISYLLAWVKNIPIRGLQGYCDDDLWGFSLYLSDILINGLTEFKDKEMGYPCKEDEDPEEAQKRWDEVLDEMIEGFKASRELSEEYPEDPEKKRKFNRAMELFHEYFFSLWI